MFPRVVIFAVLSFVFTESTVSTSKGLFCRDPDTGKLHPINATWSSTSFCGNYTCKLHKVYQSNAEQIPNREINISNINDKGNKAIIHSRNISESSSLVRDFQTKIPIQKMFNEEDKQESNDRYLNEFEIKSIAEALHKVKKSDIDALVEVYSLAQEIYQEMDKATDQEAVDKSVSNLKEKILKLDYIKDSQNHYDREQDFTNNATKSMYLKVKKVPTANNHNYATYFNAPLTLKDFGKMPYYYPESSFQRMASYVHQPTQQDIMQENPQNNQQDNPQDNQQYNQQDNQQDNQQENQNISLDTPLESKTERLKEERIPNPTPFVETKDSQKLIKPSYLLPYPFSFVNKYNMSKYANVYTSNPWVWDYYNRNRQSPYLKAYLAHIPAYTGAILVNPHLQDEEEVQDVEQPIVKTIHSNVYVNNQEPWKTQPLSNQIINEIKANVDNVKRIKKSFPLRKKVNLEKVGKVIKVEELSRKRRDTNSVFVDLEKMETMNDNQVPQKLVIVVKDDHETYIEKITCQPQMEPGYFRYGNITEPYPFCCPQLITSR